MTEQMPRRDKIRLTEVACLALIWSMLTIGCGDSRPPAVQLPNVDATTVARRALELYDTDKNGALDEKELAACRPLAAVIETYDLDKNGGLSQEEIATRIAKLYGAGGSLSNVNCKVTLAGRPLTGAIVKFVPVEMLKEELQPAEGTTDEMGVTRPAIAAEWLPESLKNAPIMQPGLYAVEITHPDKPIDAKFNTESVLGFEVNPASRTGLDASFNLK